MKERRKSDLKRSICASLAAGLIYLADTGRADGTMRERMAMGSRLALEAPALHAALKAFADGDALDVDQLTGYEMGRMQHDAGRKQGVPGHTKGLQVSFHFNATLGIIGTLKGMDGSARIMSTDGANVQEARPCFRPTICMAPQGLIVVNV